VDVREPTRPSSQRKRQAILDAAETVFLRDGFVGASVDEVAQLSGVSKQTIYNHFGSKEDLFVALVSWMSASAGRAVRPEPLRLPDGADLTTYLEEYALRQLTVVLDPRILRLRRLVIGEVPRFPHLARALWENGPLRAITDLAGLFRDLADAGMLRVADPSVAAETYNWLVMSGPLNQSMLLGDEAIPDRTALQRHAREAVRVFLAAYG
jgi:TetR/AcrR family transcriptional repressor of mexJK operon